MYFTTGGKRRVIDKPSIWGRNLEKLERELRILVKSF